MSQHEVASLLEDAIKPNETLPATRERRRTPPSRFEPYCGSPSRSSTTHVSMDRATAEAVAALTMLQATAVVFDTHPSAR